MSSAGVQPDVISYSAAISACEKAGQWEALSLLREMPAAGLRPNVVSYNAAISACEKAGRCDDALSLLQKMREDGVQPNVISFNAAIQACAAAQQPDEALRLFKEALMSVEPSCVTFNAVLDAVASPQPAIARELWLQGCERGLYPEVEKREAGAPKLDLHEHSEGAGETALRWWLEERVPALQPKPDRLIIVTGFGKSRRATQVRDLRGRVEGALAAMGAPTLPSDNPGRLVVDMQSWTDR